MRQLLFIISFLSFYVSGFSQEIIIQGKVIDSVTNTGLSYVNIGIANKGVGTVSDKDGIFKLKLNEKITSNDTILFSFIGYETKKVLVSSLRNKNATLLLEPKTTLLSEVVIKPKKSKLKKIGRSSAGLGLMSMDFYSYYEKDIDDRLSKEMGMKLELGKDCRIKDLNFHIKANQFKSLKFRVNFYKIKNGLPSELIVNKNIIFEVKDCFLGWFKVDLEPYNICFEKETKDIAVTIQWIESTKMNEKSKYFDISAAISPFNTLYFREKAMATWGKNSSCNLSFYLNALCN
jgi:hypothetical protein